MTGASILAGLLLAVSAALLKHFQEFPRPLYLVPRDFARLDQL